VNFNNAEGLQKTIQSINSQTFKDYEFLIIDGGSTDASVDVICKYHTLLNYSVSEPDNGVYHAMNKGILKATGEYCLFLNSGDILANNKVLESVFDKVIDEDIIYGNAVKVKSHYHRLIKYTPDLSLYDFYRTTAAIHHQATFIKKELFVSYGFYREDIKIIADWEFFFRVIIQNKVKTKYIDLTVCVFDGIGLSNVLKATDPDRILASQEKETILKKYFPDYILADYKKLDALLSHRSCWQKLLNRISYFSIKK